MAVSITWGTKVIYVPRADLTLIQSSPEIREMDLNWFRMQLKGLEDDEAGMPFPDTHTHNTEVELAGLVYARIIEIINGYTVEFEDGQYTVTCVGANHNLSDVRVANQVSLIVNNAAGLISNAAIEFASFNGGVSLDITSFYSGTIFPIGTPQQPVNNLADAMLIAGVRGFDTIFVVGDVTIDAGASYVGMVFIGSSRTKSTITISAAADVTDCEFYEATVQGTLDGNTKLENCTTLDLNFIYGVIESCMLQGTIVLGGSDEAHFLDCWSGVAGLGTPIIDMGGAGQDLALRNYNGGIKLINKTGTDKVSIDMNSGQIVLDSTVTDGEIVCRGIGDLTDNSTGTTSVDTSSLLSSYLVATVTWDTIWVNTTDGVSGTEYPLGTARNPVDNMVDARIIGIREKIERYHVHGDITLVDSFDGSVFLSHDADACTIDLNGQSTNNTSFDHVGLTGTCNGHINANNCDIVSVINLKGHAENCAMNGSSTVEAGETFTNDRWTSSGIEGVIFGLNGNGSLSLVNGSGIITLTDMTDASSNIAITGHYIVILASTVTAGNIYLSGIGIVNDNATSYTSYTDRTLPQTVWNESLTASTYNIPTSAGRRLRDVASSVILTEHAVSGTANTITLGNDASSVDGAYDPAMITIINGLGVGQTRLILEYEGSTKKAVIDRNWKIIPDATSEYAIVAHPGREHVNEGLATGGTINTITLNVLASDSDEAYTGQAVFIRSGTGEDQVKLVSAYDGTTKIATLSEDWQVIPDLTSGYVMIPTHTHEPEMVADAVWGAALSDHQIAGSFGVAVMSLLGVVGQNVKWTNMVFDANNNMTGVRLTSYTDNTLVTPWKQWDITATYNAQSELQTYNMVEV